MNKANISKRIKYERERLALTQRELGNMIGVTKQCISGWETGRNTPDSITLNELARVFKIEITSFFDDNIASDAKENEEKLSLVSNLTTKELLVISKLRSMPADRRKAFELLLGVTDKLS